MAFRKPLASVEDAAGDADDNVDAFHRLVLCYSVSCSRTTGICRSVRSRYSS